MAVPSKSGKYKYRRGRGGAAVKVRVISKKSE